MTKFAAYDDVAIYAVAETSEAAIEEAQSYVNGEGHFDAAEISDELFEQIERDGWNGNRQSFSVKNGEIVETTNN